MSLDFDVSAIADYANVTTKPKSAADERSQWHPVTNALVWLSIPCGYGEITETNYVEVYKRIAIWEQVCDPMLSGRDDEDWHLTLRDVQLHIGLRTNASRLTDAAFKNRVWKEMQEKALHCVTHAPKESVHEKVARLVTEASEKADA